MFSYVVINIYLFLRNPQFNSIEVQVPQIQISNLTTKNLEDGKSIQKTNCSDDSDSENKNNVTK